MPFPRRTNRPSMRRQRRYQHPPACPCNVGFIHWYIHLFMFCWGFYMPPHRHPGETLSVSHHRLEFGTTPRPQTVSSFKFFFKILFKIFFKNFPIFFVIIAGFPITSCHTVPRCTPQSLVACNRWTAHFAFPTALRGASYPIRERCRNGSGAPTCVFPHPQCGWTLPE